MHRTGQAALLSIIAASILSGCSTNSELLRLERDQWQQIRSAASQTSQLATTGVFDPDRHDLYLMINSNVFNRILEGFDGRQFELDLQGRPVDITVRSVRLQFRAGYPDILVDAVATDRRSGVEAALEMDARLVIVGDLSQPDTLAVEPVATRVVPRLRWGPLEFTKWRFVRRLLQLEAAQFTANLPKLTLPLASRFAFGSAASTQPTRFPTGNGSWIAGNVAVPSTQTTGRIVVKQVLFLPNGIHVFADVEQLP